jgi:hypothetical protein
MEIKQNVALWWLIQNKSVTPSLWDDMMKLSAWMKKSLKEQSFKIFTKYIYGHLASIIFKMYVPELF